MFDNEIDIIKSRVQNLPKIAVVLGSGLGELGEKAENAVYIDYKELACMPTSGAPGHKGRFVFGRLGDKDVVLMQGRVHMYEGYSAKEAVTPIRLLRALGVENTILTNAAGGINKNFNVGDFMMIKDHISMFVPSPLIGKNDDSIGTRFPDMSNAYDKGIQKAILTAARSTGLDIKSGVYAQLTGPQFETPSEIRALSVLGSDAVGMSTVIETIAAVHCGMKVGGISMISNLACGLLDKPLSGDEVNAAAEKVAPYFEKLITETIRNI